jgi:hypothetical protein
METVSFNHNMKRKHQHIFYNRSDKAISNRIRTVYFFFKPKIVHVHTFWKNNLIFYKVIASGLYMYYFLRGFKETQYTVKHILYHVC